MLAPDTAPKMVRLNTKVSWLAIATPDICSVPTRPTIRLSSRLTKLLMAFCTMIGITMASTMA